MQRVKQRQHIGTDGDPKAPSADVPSAGTLGRMRSKRRDATRAMRDTEQVAAAVTASRLRRVGVRIVCVYVLLVPLVFDYAADWPFVLPKAILTHGLAYLLAAVLLGLVARFGWRIVPRSWLHLPILVFLGITTLATIFAVDPAMALYGSHERMLGLATIASWTVLYFAVAILFRTREDVVALSVTALASVTVTLFYEVVQLLGADPFRWSLDVANRPISTNGQPTTLGTYLGVAALAAIATALAGKVTRTRRVILLVAAAVILAGAGATATRSVLISLAAGGVWLMAIMWLRMGRGRMRAATAVAGGVAAAALLAVVVLTPIGSRIFASPPAEATPSDEEARGVDVVSLDASPVLASLDARFLLYRVAFDAVLERPLVGYGPDNFAAAMARHRPETGLDLLRLSYATSAHSWIAAVAVGSGVPGLIAFACIAIGALLLALWRRMQASAVVGGVVVVAFLGAGITTVSDIASDWVFWLAAGLIVAATASPTEIAMENPAPTRRSKATPTFGFRPWRYIAGTSLAFALVLAFSGQAALQASHDAQMSRNARLQGHADVAVQYGLASVRNDQGRPEYWSQLGLAYVASSRWRDAAASFERAHKSAPWDARPVIDLIQTQLVLMQNGDSAARSRALQLATDVMTIDPNYPDALFARAQVLQATGNNEEALRAVERAIALAPKAQTPQWYLMASQLDLALGRPADAVAVAERGLAIRWRADLALELVRAFVASGDLPSALAEVNSILKDQPDNAAAQQLRSQIQAAMTR